MNDNHVLVLAQQWFPDYVGGTARVATDSAAALARAGHTVTAVAPRDPSSPPSKSFERGVHVHRVVRRTLIPQTYADPIAITIALRRLDLEQVDAVLAHHPTTLVAAARAFPHSTLAYVFHASPYREAQHRRSAGTLTRVERLRSRAVEPALRLLERQSADRADRILVLSDFSRGLISEDHASNTSKIVNVGGAVDTSRFSPATSQDKTALRRSLGSPPTERLLITTRRLVPRMGLDRLVDAFHAIAAKQPDLGLVIVGDGELRAPLADQIARRGLSGHVRLAGRVDDATLAKWYRAADLFVLPTVAYEGFGIATAESLSSGTPVVGTPVGATPEILRNLDSNLIADDASAESLARAIEYGLAWASDPINRQRCRNYAVQALDWAPAAIRWSNGIFSHA